MKIKYKRILYELSKDARISASKLAKKAGMSKDTVIYAINSMVKKKIIKRFVTLINTESFGLTRYELYIQVKGQENELIKYLKNHPMFIWVRSALGEWEILSEFYAKDIFEYEKILREINNKYSSQIKKTNPAIVLIEHSFPLKCIGYKEEEPFGYKEEEPIKKIKKIKLDKKDLAILRELSKNARINVIEIANKTNMSSDTVIYRIKNMTKSGMIKGYRVVVDETFLGLAKYKILLKLKGVNDQTHSRLLSYLKFHNSTQYVKQCVGDWNFSITLLAKDLNELRTIISDIKTNLKEELEEYKILIMFEEHKNTYFPEGIK